MFKPAEAFARSCYVARDMSVTPGRGTGARLVPRGCPLVPLIEAMETRILLDSTTFGPEQELSLSVDCPESVYATDLDGDGDADILSASREDGMIAWYENLGGGDFSAQRVISTMADYASSVYATDLDGDGDADVLSASAYEDKIAWYENLLGPTLFIQRRGVGVSVWGNGRFAGEASESMWSDNGGMVIDPSWTQISGVEATYRFLLPEPDLAGGMFDLRVRVHGKGHEWAFEPALYAGPASNRVELTEAVPEEEGVWVYSVPISALVDASMGGLLTPGHWLDVALVFGAFDSYDMRSVSVEYSVLGADRRALMGYQVALEGTQTLLSFAENAADGWPSGTLSTDSFERTLTAVMPGIGNFLGLIHPLGAAVVGAYKMIDWSLPQVLLGMGILLGRGIARRRQRGWG